MAESSASSLGSPWLKSKEGKSHRLNPIARALLQGIYDENSELHKLNGMWHILQQIWREIIFYWKLHIKCTADPQDDENQPRSSADPKGEEDEFRSYLNLSLSAIYPQPKSDPWYFTYIGSPISFPEPSELNINMMPFVMGYKFESCFLPEYLKSYWATLIQRCPIGKSDFGKVGYLTIHESFVDQNTSQRRPGIHTESPGRLLLHEKGEQGNEKIRITEGQGSSCTNRRCWSFWGRGKVGVSQLEGGIFMASTADNSCRIWNCQIMEDDLIGELGDIEHLREFLPYSEVMNKNQLYWLTDRTPHESLPLEQGAYRQFFRLVTSQVSHWYEDHSTKNPLGITPDPEITKIVRGSKFNKAGVVIVDSVEASSGKSGFKAWLKSKAKKVIP